MERDERDLAGTEFAGADCAGADCAGTNCAAPDFAAPDFAITADEAAALAANEAAAEFRLLCPWLSTLGPRDLVDLLTLLDLRRVPADGAMDALVAAQRLINWAEACKVRVMSGVYEASAEPESPWFVPDPELGATLLASEVACALTLPEGTARALVEDSHDLSNRFPSTLKALASGEITLAKAQVILEQSEGVPESALAEFERQLLARASALTRPKLAAAARRLREKLHPEALGKRRAKAVKERSVSVEPAKDGMAWFSAYIPAEAAVAAYNRITAAAISVQGPDEGRTLGQLRADVLVDMLLSGGVAGCAGECATGCTGSAGADSGAAGAAAKDLTAAWLGIRPQVSVTVPIQTCLGEDLPAHLDGYGPIPPEVARRLAAAAPSFTRLLTHPETGAVLSVGRNSYTVPASLRRYLETRDKTCRFPGCNRNVKQCDLDHTRDWQHNGATAHDNLAHLCPKHHMLKHRTRWGVEQQGGGTLSWTSPGGKTYLTRPDGFDGVEFIGFSGAPPGSGSPGSQVPESAVHRSPDWLVDYDAPPPF